MTSHHDPCFSTAALTRKRLERPGTKSEASSNGLGAAPNAGLVKLPTSIKNHEAAAFKACGHTFRQHLDRNATWQSLKAPDPELTPYSLRHGYAWRAAKYYPQPLPLRDTAKLMGHDLKTHIRHYGQWTDDASTRSAVEASIQSLVGAS